MDLQIGVEGRAEGDDALRHEHAKIVTLRGDCSLAGLN